MSQYAPNSTLSWYVAPTSPLNGTFTGTISINSTLAKFLSSTPSIYYTIFNYSASVSGNSGTVKADIWYVLRNGTVTLKLPYLMTYSYVNGSWVLTGDWWGLPNSPGTAVTGIASPVVITAKTITSSTSSASSSSSTSISYTTKTTTAVSTT